MSNTGKVLEAFVRQIEEIMLPKGFAVTSNERICDEDGVQIAEFDIEIEGTIGSTKFRWLIECRDRPSDGPAPSSWIEQLVGRRQRFNLDKVIAVSTTGFAKGAIGFARQSGIEIRSVTASNLEDVKDWFVVEEMTLSRTGGSLRKAILLVDPTESDEMKLLLKRRLDRNGPTDKILRSTENDELITLSEAFRRAVNSVGTLHTSLLPNGGEKCVNLRVAYPNDDSHFVVDTEQGRIRIREILFHGEIVVTIEKVPVAAIRRYESLTGGIGIADAVSFSCAVDGRPVEISFQRVVETGETHVFLRASAAND